MDVMAPVRMFKPYGGHPFYPVGWTYIGAHGEVIPHLCDAIEMRFLEDGKVEDWGFFKVGKSTGMDARRLQNTV